ncbi:MAG: DUF2141 domain-containing protein [Sphingobium sp.]|jgi:uncharacterized protein (DUF2141 family)|nr:DUF2141 domain-containing protein [Sphingobium sp.]MCI1271569.1 DUF2141 domain-containing protein [Sphingobium sp.]MCI1756088.1 DUF2141 domain-containing protein [Sphingobium sp.]MCI2052665.1 DUF2141 domain-containing protein [Sphingobium sp.]
MSKISGVFRKAALCAVAAALVIGGSVASPVLAYAQRQVIDNDMARCAADAGPSIIVEVSGFEASTGIIRLQSYPATRTAWLEKGAWINRIEAPARPVNGKMRFCMPLPASGRYGVAVRHDVNGNGKTDLSRDGGGFSNNPKVSIFNLGKPSVDKAAVAVGNTPVIIAISLQYM